MSRSGSSPSAGSSSAAPAFGGATGRLRKALDKLQKGQTLRVLGFGDSYITHVNHSKLPFQWPKIVAAAGGSYAGAFASSPATGSIGTVGADTGTIVSNLSDYDAWPSGLTSTFPAGAKRSYGIGGVNAVWTDAVVYYVKEPGAGTLTLQTDDVDEGAFTAIDASNAGGITVGIAHLTKGTSAQRKFSVTVAGAPVRIISPELYDTTRLGAITQTISQGGITLVNAMSTATGRANYRTVLADLAPDVIFFEMDEDSTTFQSTLSTWLSDTQTAVPLADIVLIGSPGKDPAHGGDSERQAQNAISKAAAVGSSGNVIYWDGFVPYAVLNALPAAAGGTWAGDGLHVSADAAKDLGAKMLTDLGLWRGFGAKQSASLIEGGGLVFGYNADGTPYGRIKQDSVNLDAILEASRAFRFAKPDGTVVGQMVTGTGLSSYWPSMPINASTNPALFPTSTDMLGPTATGGGGAWKRASAAAYVTAVAKTTQAAAATLDTNANGVHWVTLTGAPVVLTINNGTTDGQHLEINLIQDATGSRTVTWPSNMRFAGGAAPTLSTTPNGVRDVLTFRWDNSNAKWREVSRSLGVPN